MIDRNNELAVIEGWLDEEARREAESAGVVREAHRRAGVPVSRVIEVSALST